MKFIRIASAPDGYQVVPSSAVYIGDVAPSASIAPNRVIFAYEKPPIGSTGAFIKARSRYCQFFHLDERPYHLIKNLNTLESYTNPDHVADSSLYSFKIDPSLINTWKHFCFSGAFTEIRKALLWSGSYMIIVVPLIPKSNEFPAVDPQGSLAVEPEKNLYDEFSFDEGEI